MNGFGHSGFPNDRTAVKRIATIVLVCCIAAVRVVAQQDPLLTQYMFNQNTINPAYAGSKDAVSANMIFRRQWVGIEGAPQTESFSIHSPLPNHALGLGLSALKDEYGPVESKVISLDLAYKFRLSSYRAAHPTTLALGIKGGLNLASIQLTGLENVQTNDPLFATDIQNEPLPIVGFGAYAYASNYYLGFAIPQFLQHDHVNDVDQHVSLTELHYYFHGGMLFDLNPRLMFKPTAMVRASGGAPVVFDVTTNFIFNEILWVGAFYRYNNAVGAIFQVQVVKDLRIGYAYDHSLTDIAQYSSGSHEFMIAYDFSLSRRNKIIYSPRWF